VIVVLAIIFAGKLLIPEVVNLVFGDDIELGQTVEVIALIITMMAARPLRLAVRSARDRRRAGGRLMTATRRGAAPLRPSRHP
jgi:hypothetical protein